MECGLGQVLGFTSEALGFVVALERLLDTRIEGSTALDNNTAFIDCAYMSSECARRRVFEVVA